MTESLQYTEHLFTETLRVCILETLAITKQKSDEIEESDETENEKSTKRRIVFSFVNFTVKMNSEFNSINNGKSIQDIDEMIRGLILSDLAKSKRDFSCDDEIYEALKKRMEEAQQILNTHA